MSAAGEPSRIRAWAAAAWWWWSGKILYVATVPYLVGFFYDGPFYVRANSATTWVLYVMVAIGVLAAIWVFLVKGAAPCPNCGRHGRPVMVRQGLFACDAGVDCEDCGLVHANFITDFRFHIKSSAVDVKDEQESGG